MKSFQLQILFILLLQYLTIGLVSGKEIRLESEALPAGKMTSYLQDSRGDLTLAEVLKPEFQRGFQVSNKEIHSYPLSDKPVWLKLEFEASNREALYLLLENYLLDSIQAYFLTDGGQWHAVIRGQATQEGNQNPFVHNYVLPFPDNASGKQVVYIRVKALSGLLIPIWVANEKGLDAHVSANSLFMGLILGMFLLLIILVLIAWVRLKDPPLLFFLIELVVTGYGFMMIKGLSNQLIWKGYLPMAKQYFPFAMLMMISFSLLCMSFLETRKRFPKLHIGFLVLIGLDVAMAFLHAPTTLPSAIISFNLGLICPLYSLGVAIYAWRQKVPGALFYTIGWGGYVIMLSSFLLTAFQVVPGNFFTQNAPVFGVFFESFFFILAMSQRVSNLVKEKDHAEQEKILSAVRISSLQSKADLLEKEKTQVQYESLKQQLNPHFLFNSLASLGSLIRINPKMAADFLEGMSKSYRYILKSQEHETVPLTEEIRFTETYIKLQKVRFENALETEFRIPEEEGHLKIVPVTIQNLIENALKHNIVDTESPLHIEVFIEDNHLVVRNNLQKKSFVETSNKRGLQNLVSLYRYLDDRPVRIEEKDGFFSVWVPLI